MRQFSLPRLVFLSSRTPHRPLLSVELQQLCRQASSSKNTNRHSGSDSSKETHYEVLEVSSLASADEIKQSFYKLSRKYHPDVNANDSQAIVKFQKVSEAYNVLGDAKLRRAYDRGTLKKEFSVSDYEATSHKYKGEDFDSAKRRFKAQYDSSSPLNSNLESLMKESRKAAFKDSQIVKRSSGSDLGGPPKPKGHSYDASRGPDKIGGKIFFLAFATFVLYLIVKS